MFLLFASPHLDQHNILTIGFYGRLSSFIEYGTDKFDKKINLGRRIKIQSSYPMERLDNLVSLVSGVTYDKEDQIYEESGNMVLTADNISTDGIFSVNKVIYLKTDTVLDDRKKLYKDDIFICLSSGSKEHVGKCAIISADTPYYAGGFMGIMRRKNENILPKYLWAILSSQPYRMMFGQNSTGTNINNVGSMLGNIRVPLLPMVIQQRIVKEIEELETEYISSKTQLRQHKAAIEQLFDATDCFSKEPLGQVVMCNPSKSEISALAPDTLISFVEMAAVSNDGYIVGAVDRPLRDIRKGSYTYFGENDVIIAKITPCMENGKCALATGLTNGVGMGSSEFHVFRCGDKVLPRYLFGYLNRTAIRVEAEKVMTGQSGHRRVPVTFYQQLPFPVPSLNEQGKIIDKIELHEAEIVRLKERLNELRAFQNAVLRKYI